MDIHKPKPWHGWRELLKEVGTIVIGVLIALGAEQAVEWLHWRAKVANEVSAIQEEAKLIESHANERILIQVCLDRRVDQLETRVRQADGELAPEPFWLQANARLGGVPYMAPIRPWGDSVWRAANMDGTTNHMPRNQMLAYSRAYDEIAMLRAENAREFDVLSRTGILQRGATLTPSDKTFLLGILEELRRDNALMALQSGQVLETLKNADVPPFDFDPSLSGTYGACKTQGLLETKTPMAVPR